MRSYAWLRSALLFTCAWTMACGASVRTVGRTRAGEAPTVHAREGELAVTYGLRWARLDEGAQRERRWRAVVVRDKATPTCPGAAAGEACLASCPADHEVPGTDGEVRISERCEEVELLGLLSATADPIETRADPPLRDVDGGFTEYGVRSFKLREPCSADRRCRVWWTLQVSAGAGPDAATASYDWREDVPDRTMWPGCSVPKRPREAPPAGGECTTSWHPN